MHSETKGEGMTETIELRVALMEEKHKALAEKYADVIEKLANLEKAQNKQDLTNEKILGAVTLINTKMDTKKESNTLWYPVIVIIVFEIIKEFLIPLFTK